MPSSGRNDVLSDDEVSKAADQVVRDFQSLLIKEHSAYSQDAIFLLKTCDPEAASTLKRLRAKMNRRRDNRRSRDLDYFIRHFQELSKVDGFCQDQAIKYIREYYDPHPLFDLDHAYSPDDVRTFAEDCFRNGCITVNFWLGKYGVWLLVGQKS